MKEPIRTLTRNKLWKNKIFWIILLCFIAIAWIPPNTNEIKARLGRKMGDDDIMRGFLVIGIDPDPCSAAIGIAIEDERYMFSKISNMNATLAADGVNIAYPGSGKNDAVDMYVKAIENVTNLRLGKIVDERGNEVWAISKQQLIEAYPHKTFPIILNEEEGRAIDYSELFFEILLTAQKNHTDIAQLKRENEELKKEIEEIKAFLGLTNHDANKIQNTLKVSPNPATNGQITFDYEISQNAQKADIFIYNLQGQMMEYIPINAYGKNKLQYSIDYPKGMYNCSLAVDGKIRANTKLVIQ